MKKGLSQIGQFPILGCNRTITMFMSFFSKVIPRPGKHCKILYKQASCPALSNSEALAWRFQTIKKPRDAPSNVIAQNNHKDCKINSNAKLFHSLNTFILSGVYGNRPTCCTLRLISSCHACTETREQIRLYSTNNAVKVEQREAIGKREMLHTDVVIIGAGVIGAAISSRLVKEFPNHILLEKNKSFGQEISSRNSEVVHAGLYYKEGSLKSILCREGNPIMYKTCQRWGVKVKKCGKWLIATTEEENEYLENLKEVNSSTNTAQLRWIKYCSTNYINENDYYSKLTNWERKLIDDSFSILESVDTGIVDSHSLMEAMLLYSSTGNTILNEDEKSVHAYNCEVIDIIMERPEQFEVVVRSDEEIFSIKSNIVINAAGLFSSKLSQALFNKIFPNHPDISKYNIHYVKGNYFTYQNRNLFHRLIYPVPDKEVTSLGVHLTIDMQNNIRFGPDVEYLGTNPENINYQVDETKKEKFFYSISKYIPTGIELEKLVPAYAGVRPKLQGPGEPFRDFIIQEESDKNCKGFISLCGIESPGLTSSLAIANRVAKIIGCSPKFDF